ncbi:hypothetical protein AB7309_22015 [Providencia manganoxydans]|uniref:hypothetical protein n=1 Tax=Providencia manganoxydans TaxID=2923283 RepID=UPI000C718EDA
MSKDSTIPELGSYVSKTDPNFRIIVTDVYVLDDENSSSNDKLFYLVSLIEGDDEDDMSVMGYELDPTEWLAFVEVEQLVFERDPYIGSIPENSCLAEIRDFLMQKKNNL